MPPCAECKASTCWTEKTKLEKWLILSLILIGTLALALVLTCFYLSGWLTKSANPKINEKEKKSDFQNESEPLDNVCKTPSCILAAKTILENIDPTVSPCENFYDFACGNFVKTKIIPEDATSISTQGLVADRVLEEMKTMLEESTQKGELKVFQLMKKFYKQCMDTNTSEKDGLNTIRSILKDFGGWPLLEGDKWVESKFDWKEVSYKFQHIGFVDNPLFQVIVEQHNNISSRRVLIVTDEARSINFAFRSRLWTEEDVRKAYFQFLVDASILLGADKNKSIKEIKDMFDFRVKMWDLPRNTGPREEMSVNQLQHKISYISWVDYINKLLTPHVKITGDEIVHVFRQEYLKGLESLLPVVSNRTLANYMMWHFVFFSAKYSNQALRQARFKFEQVTSGIVTQPARWKFCVKNYIFSFADSTERQSLYIGAGALFIRKYFNNKTKQEAHAMVSSFRLILRDTMEKIKWMDAKTKSNALDKLKEMIIKTAYPDEFLDDKKLESFYGNLTLDENDFLKSFLKLKLFDIRNHYRRLREPYSRHDWILSGESVGIVNAYNHFLLNRVDITAAMLLDPMFSITRPNYLNYGFVGSIIGHEFTHGFDTLGKERDKYGNKVDWWEPETKDLFLKKTQCFVEQYNKYVVPDLNMNVNGKLTLAENIADNGGIAVSYKAYQELIKKQGCDQALPGVNYTQNQLFWIAAANSWCTKIRVERQQSDLGNDNHAPNRFRVIGFLSNSKEFSKDFRCSSKSKMNPKHKCKLW